MQFRIVLPDGKIVEGSTNSRSSNSERHDRITSRDLTSTGEAPSKRRVKIQGGRRRWPTRSTGSGNYVRAVYENETRSRTISAERFSSLPVRPPSVSQGNVNDPARNAQTTKWTYSDTPTRKDHS